MQSKKDSETKKETKEGVEEKLEHVEKLKNDRKSKEKRKENEPINYSKEVKNFLRSSEKEEKYLKQYKEQILRNNKLPPLWLEIDDLSEKLYNLFKKEITKFSDIFKERLYEELSYDIQIKDLFKDRGYSHLDLHIIPDSEDLDIHIPIIEDFSVDLTPYTGKLIKIVGRSQNSGLIKSIEWEKMVFQCKICGTVFDFEDPFHKIVEKYKVPSNCVNPNCNANSKKDFTFIEHESESYEIRYFSIVDRDFNRLNNEKKCVIIQNIDYFIEKAKDINLEGEIEVMGILRRDYSDLFRYRKEEQEFSYYIEVVDMKPRKSKRVNEELIKEIYKEKKQNNKFLKDILDSIHPYSKKIYDYRIAKMIFVFSIITGDAWWVDGEKVKSRPTINSIIGGHTGTLKSHIGDDLQKVLGRINLGKIDSQDTTDIGLIPTTQRSNRKEQDIIKRHGAFRYYSKKTLILDESQYLGTNALESHKYLESGVIERALDGSLIREECEGSVIHLMNYKENEEIKECYDYSKKLEENLGPNYAKQKSILERFDLHYAIPRMTKRIEKILSRRDLNEPERIYSEDFLFNYLIEAKKLYPEVEPTKQLEEELIIIKDALIDTEDNMIRTPRHFKILKRLVCGIAASRLKEKADLKDLEFLKKHLINTIIPFYDIDVINQKRTINMEEIWCRTLVLLGELKDYIPIDDHIEFIREELEKHYFHYENPQFKDPSISNKINNYMPDTGSLSNSKYRDLIENEDLISFAKEKGFIRGKVNNRTHFLKKEKVKKEIKEEIRECFRINKEPVKEKGMVQLLEVNTDFDRRLIKDFITRFVEDGYLSKEEEFISI